MAQCEKCHSKLADGVKFCKFCGASAIDTAVVDTIEKTVPDAADSMVGAEAPQSTTPKKHSRAWIWIILALVGICIAILVAVLYGQHQNQKNEELLDQKHGIVPQDYVGIYTPEDFDSIRNNLSSNYILMNDIDLSGFENWMPIGDLEHKFTGELNGNYFTIRGMTIDIESEDSIYAGLFGYVENGTVVNLGLRSCEISVSSTENVPSHVIGGIAATINSSTIRNCYTEGKIYSKTGFYTYIGGLIGSANGSTIKYCYNASNIVCTMPRASTDIGGIVGSSDNTKLSDCYNQGSVEVKSESTLSVGGLLGFASSTVMENGYNIGTLTASSRFGGGGGIVGVCLFTSEISNCFYLNGQDFVGHYVPNSGGKINNVNALTADQMKQQSFFTGFDFDKIWGIGSYQNSGYPFLRNTEEFHADNSAGAVDITAFSVPAHTAEVSESALVLGTLQKDETASYLFDENGFVFSDSDRRLLTQSEIDAKAINSTYDEKRSLQFMINEIYARHGAIFQNEINSSHFELYSWYKSLPKKTLESAGADLNTTESANIALLVRISKEKGYR